MRFYADQRLIVVVVGLIWAEVSLLPHMAIRMIQPDFLFVFLVFYAFRIHWKNVVALAFILGLAKDLLTNSFFGLETASYTAGAVALEFLVIRFERDKFWIQLASLFSFSWFTLLIFFFLVLAIEAPGMGSGWFVMKPFLVALYTTAVGFVALPLLEKWVRPRLVSRQYELF